jgi:hypothetical protein
VTATQATLYSFGAFLELIGIVLVASPDLVPGARRFSRWLAPRLRRVENRLRRLLRLRGRNIVINAEPATVVVSAGNVSFSKSVSADATLERKVEFLLQRDQEAQSAANELGERVSAIERESPRQLDELRERMEAHVSTELVAALAEYRPARVIGTIALAIGLGLATAANLIA